MAAGPVQIRIDVTRYMTFDRKEVRKAMRKGAAILRKESKKLATRPGPAPSAPAEPPRRQTSALWRSIYARASRRGYAIVGGTLVPHAHMLEVGTQKMQPRPLMPVGLGKVRDDVIRLLQDAIGSGLTPLEGSPGKAPDRVERG